MEKWGKKLNEAQSGASRKAPEMRRKSRYRFNICILISIYSSCNTRLKIFHVKAYKILHLRACSTLGDQSLLAEQIIMFTTNLFVQ